MWFYWFISDLKSVFKVFFNLNTKRQEYKLSGGSTTNLHRHIENKHPSISEKINKDKNIGSMDKFVNAIPVCLNFFILFFFIN